jgi:hypothetical protein
MELKFHSGDEAMREGDRVRLAERVARTLNKVRFGQRKGVDWIKRRGSVVCISVVSDTVTVKWDDRESRDPWPIKAIQVVKDSSEVRSE